MLRVYFTLLFLFSFFVQSVEAQNPFNLLEVFKKNSEKQPSEQNQNEDREEIPLTLPVPIDQPATSPAAPPIEEPKAPAIEEPKAPAIDTPLVDDPFGFDTPSAEPALPKTPTILDPANPPAPRPVVQTPVTPQELIPTPVPAPAPVPSPIPTPFPTPIQATNPDSISRSDLNPVPTRGYFGAVVKSLGKGQAGIQITSVTPNSPAAAAGLKAGDRMLSMADSPLSSEAEVLQIIEVLSPGDRIEVEIYRDRQRLKKSLVIGALPSASQIAQAANVQTPRNEVAPKHDFPVVPVPAIVNSGQPKSSQNPTNVVQQRPRIGITVVDGKDVIRSGLRSRVVNGGGIESIDPRSPAAAAGLSVGSLIVGINDTPVQNSGEIVKLIAAMRPGQRVNVTYYENRELKRTTVQLGSEPMAVQQASARQSVDLRVDPRFQPVPGAQFESAPIVERPIMKRIGENMPLVRRVDNLIDRFSHQPAPQPQLQPVVPTGGTRTRAEQRQLEEIIRTQQLQIQMMNQRLQDLETPRRRR